MITEVRVEGAKELRAQLRRAGGPELAKELQKANKAAAEKVVRAALPNVPVRTGRLKASVRATASQASGRAMAGKARVPYAAAVHWGEGAGNVNHRTGATVGRPERNIRGRPFLWEAADRMLAQVIEEYEGDITGLLERTIG